MARLIAHGREAGTGLAAPTPVRLTFDRGTLLLTDVPAGFDPSSLPGVLWDPRVRGFRAPARLHEALASELRRLGVPFADVVRSTDARDAPAGWSPAALRPYQEAALGAWQIAGGRGLVVLPTGSGKTRVAIAAMARTGGASLCLVPTRALLDQWTRAIGEQYRGPVGRFGDGERSWQPITVATFESAWRQMDQIGARFDLMIVDEAHHFGHGLRDEALEMSAAPRRLGLTATPPPGGPGRTRLTELVGPVVFELAVGDLAGSFLAPFDAITLHLELTAGERQRYEEWTGAYRAAFHRFMRTAPGAGWQEFLGAAARSDEGRRAIAAWTRARRLLAYPRAKREALSMLLERHRAQRIIVFVADNETAYAVARQHLIMPLTCDIARKERADVLARFRDGGLHALVSAQVLNEGIDVPDADVGIVVAGRLGEREHVQRVGRVLRPGPDKRALVYELVVRDSSEVRQATRRAEGLVSRSGATG
jgi:superfamily II DNA or RNA helicase